MPSLFTRIFSDKKQFLTISLVVIGVAILGTILLLASHAANPSYVSINADQGTLTSPATQQTCSGASDGKCVTFGTAGSGSTSTPTGYTGTCTQTISPSTTSGAIAAAESNMSAGQVLCLNSGTYGSVNGLNYFGTSGSSGSPITITSGPGQTATIVGAEYFSANYLTIENLNIDNDNNQYDGNGGANPAPCAYPTSESVELDGTGLILQDNNVYTPTPALRGVLIGIGYNTPSDVIVRDNKISDGGSCGQTQHLIYDDSGSGTQIYNNWFWDDAYGYCVQLYPNPDATQLYSNVFDGCIDGTVDATAQGGDQTYNNVSMNSIQDPSTIGSFTSGYAFLCLSGSPATVDTIYNNASYNNFNGIVPSCSGVTSSGNITLSSDPFVDSKAHNYTLSPSAPSSLSSYNLWNGNGPPVPDPAPANTIPAGENNTASSFVNP